MQMTLETLGQLERRLHVAVPKAQIEGEVRKRLENLAKTVKIAGFRPGHVPLKMVAQQYGPQVRSDVITDTVQASLNDAIRTQNLRVAGYPRIEPKEGAAEDEFAFSAVFEVYPEIKIGDLATVTIERPVAEVAPADVDRTIEILRKQRARYEPVLRPAQSGDQVIIDFTGTIDGVEFQGGQARDFAIILGEGKMVPGFEDEVTGMSAGEEKKFALVFPADYHGREVAGKKAQFALTLKSVSEPHLPPVDEEFARNFGIASGSLDELRTEIASNHTVELRRKIEGVLRDQVMKALQTTSPGSFRPTDERHPCRERAQDVPERVRRRTRRRPDRRGRRVSRARRSIRLREDNAAPHDRRPRKRLVGTDRHRRRRRHERSTPAPRRGDGVPGLRAVPAHDRRRKPRIRPAVEQDAEART